MEQEKEPKDIINTHPELLINMEKQGQSIEEAATEYVLSDNYYTYLGNSISNAFIIGAKSQAAREYWFNIFKNQ